MATLTHTTSGYYQGKTLETLEKLILWELGQVIGTTPSFDRFPKWLIREKLNDRQNQFVFESQCIKKMALLLCKEDYRRYKLPVNCMDNGVIAAKFYSSSTDYEDLEIVDLDFMNTKMQGYLVEDSSDPEYAFMGEMYGNIPMLEVHPAPDADGTAYTTSSDTGVTVGGGDIPGVSSNITGQATGGAGTELDDTAVDFTAMGLVDGMAVVNVTDGSQGVIDTVAATKITLASTLTGGTANTFSAGDSYNILAGEYGVLTAWDDDDVFIFSSEVGALASVTVPAGNIRVDYIPYPLTFPATENDDQYPEIPKIYHGDLAIGVVADLLGSFHEKSREFNRATLYESKFQAAVRKASNLKSSRPFQRKPSKMRVRFR